MTRWLLSLSLLLVLWPLQVQAYESLGKVEDAANPGGQVGVPMLCTRQDTLASSTSTDGDYGDCKQTTAGRIYTDADTELPAPALLTDNTANPTVPGVATFNMCWDVVGQNWDRCVSGINYNEDVASAGGEQVTIVGAIRTDTLSSQTSANGDYSTLVTDSINRLWIRDGNPCMDPARISSVKISTSASGNVEQVALQSGQTIYVCGFDVIAGAATAVKFVYGTGTACATGQTDLTGAWSFAANGGVVHNNSGAVQFKTASANALCTNNSGANSIQGLLTYVQTATP